MNTLHAPARRGRYARSCAWALPWLLACSEADDAPRDARIPLPPAHDATGALPFDAALPAAPHDAHVAPDGAASPEDASGSTAPVEAGPTGAPDSGAAVGFAAGHGALHVRDGRLVDAHGAPLQLRGMSLFWSQWSDFYSARTVDALVDDWQVTLVRAALGVENAQGYLEAPQANRERVTSVVDQAIARGIYVIIDWHDHHAQDHLDASRAFFAEMAARYGASPNVIFEIYNEPMSVEWPVVKRYAEDVLATIRGAGARNLVVVGTPNWSQDVDVAASAPVSGDDNVAYTLHFYAATHKQALREKALAALARGLPLFVTEWGTCSADGNGSVDEAESRTWLTFLNERGVSWANWALNDKAEACSALLPNAGSAGP